MGKSRRMFPGFALLALFAALAAGSACLHWLLQVDACLYAFVGICALMGICLLVDRVGDRLRGWRIRNHRFEVVSYEERRGGRWQSAGFDVVCEGDRFWVEFDDESWGSQPDWARARRAEIQARLEQALASWSSN